jgi:purine nucleoside permease
MRRRLALIASFALAARAADTPIPVKVVVLTMFERGADTGDEPGEFQFWVEREKLNRVLPLGAGFHDLRMNQEGVLGTVTGYGAARAAASVMALGLDPRFDLRKSYWLVAGIAGADPERASLGSAAWAEWVVDGDLAYEIDAREIPPDWKTGYIPFGRSTPYQQTRQDRGEAFHLNSKLVEWALESTKNAMLEDSASLRAARAPYVSPAAQRPPFVLKGDDLSASTFWYGRLMNQWANDWVRYHTGGKGTFVMTAMEDAGILQSLTFLGHSSRVDLNRVLVLRTASNFDQPPPGRDAAAEFARIRSEGPGTLPGLAAALESAWRVGHVVVRNLVSGWSQYRDRLPSEIAPNRP